MAYDCQQQASSFETGYPDICWGMNLNWIRDYQDTKINYYSKFAHMYVCMSLYILQMLKGPDVFTLHSNWKKLLPLLN